MISRPDSPVVERRASSSLADLPAEAQGGIVGKGQDVRLGRRTVVLVVVVSTLVAAALRLALLGHASLWLDEIFSREIATEPTLAGLWSHVQRTESTPPLYYVIDWLIGARSAVSLRLIPALALTAAVPVGYLAFRRVVGQRAALAVAAMLAVSPMLVSYSMDARSYGLLVLSGLLSIWGFTAVLARATAGRYAFWALACTACIWSHYFGGFLVAGEALVLLWRLRERRWATLCWLIAIGVLVTPLIPLVTHQASSERAAWIEMEPLGTRVTTMVRQFAMGPNVPRSWLEGIGLAVWWVAAGIGTLVAVRRHRGAWLLVVLTVSSVGGPLLIGLIAGEDRFSARNVIVAIPLVAALAAPAMLRLRATPLIAYLLLALLAAVWVETNWRYEQANWRDAIARIEAVDPAVPVIAITRSGEPVARRYLERSVVPPDGVVTRAAWIVVEPTRGPHDRALVPASVPVVPGFVAVREMTVEAFRLVLVRASRPIHISSGVLPYATIFPPS